jgi:hypothetical protein
VLFLLFGSSGAGKTAALDALRGRIGGLAVHDFDEIGVPPGADTGWRQRSNETWVRRALDYQGDGVDLLLAGQTPFGELLAAPSAPRLEAISACLLDCDDETRSARLHERGSASFARSSGDLEAYLSWAEWMRGHATDPTWQPDVILEQADDDAHWERWAGWRKGDPRWRVRVLDSSDRSVEQVASELAQWIEEEGALVRSGLHPLSDWAVASDRL